MTDNGAVRRCEDLFERSESRSTVGNDGAARVESSLLELCRVATVLHSHYERTDNYSISERATSSLFGCFFSPGGEKKNKEKSALVLLPPPSGE